MAFSRSVRPREVEVVEVVCLGAKTGRKRYIIQWAALTQFDIYPEDSHLTISPGMG